MPKLCRTKSRENEHGTKKQCTPKLCDFLLEKLEDNSCEQIQWTDKEKGEFSIYWPPISSSSFNMDDVHIYVLWDQYKSKSKMQISYQRHKELKSKFLHSMKSCEKLQKIQRILPDERKSYYKYWKFNNVSPILIKHECGGSFQTCIQQGSETSTPFIKTQHKESLPECFEMESEYILTTKEKSKLMDKLSNTSSDENEDEICSKKMKKCESSENLVSTESSMKEIGQHLRKYANYLTFVQNIYEIIQEVRSLKNSSIMEIVAKGTTKCVQALSRFLYDDTVAETSSDKRYNNESLFLIFIPTMKKFYSKDNCYMNSLLWDHTRYDYSLKDYFINLELHENDPMGYSILSTINHPKELFKQRCINKTILITGNPGCGKTTLMKKLSYDWATLQSSHYLSIYDLVLFIPLRETGNKTVKEIIFDILFNRQKEEIVTLRKIKLNILILLDGYDETLNKESVLNFIHCEEYWNSTIFITSRPHAVKELRYSSLRRYHITGFSKQNQAKYIRVVCGKENEEQIFKINEKLFSELASSPLILHILCCLHKDMKSMTNTTELYIEIFNLITKRYGKKYGNSHFFKKGKFLFGEELFLKIGKISWSYLNNRISYITDKDFKSILTEEEFLILSELDIIVASIETKKNEEIIVFNTFHNTFLEFLCVVYLVCENQYKIIIERIYNNKQYCSSDSTDYRLLSYLCELMKYNISIEEIIKLIYSIKSDEYSDILSSLCLPNISPEISKDELLNMLCRKISCTQNSIHNEICDILFVLKYCRLHELKIKGDLNFSQSDLKQLEEYIKRNKNLKSVHFFLEHKEILYKEDSNEVKICYINVCRIFDVILHLASHTEIDIILHIGLRNNVEEYLLPEDISNIETRKLFIGLICEDLNIRPLKNTAKNQIKTKYSEKWKRYQIMLLITLSQHEKIKQDFFLDCYKTPENLCVSFEHDAIVSIHNLSY